MYEYKAVIREVYDGDTVRADIDLGFGMWMHRQALRLAGIDAPELRGETIGAGRAARDFLRNLLLDEPVVIRTHKAGKYGRWLAEIYRELAGGGRVLVNAELIEAGHAVPYPPNP